MKFGWKSVVILSALVIALYWWMHQPEQEQKIGRGVNAVQHI
jgi:hypothetical protein